MGEHRHINKQMTAVLSERNSSHVQRDCNCGGIWFSFTAEVTFPPGPEMKKYQVRAGEAGLRVWEGEKERWQSRGKYTFRRTWGPLG